MSAITNSILNLATNNLSHDELPAVVMLRENLCSLRQVILMKVLFDFTRKKVR